MKNRAALPSARASAAASRPPRNLPLSDAAAAKRFLAKALGQQNHPMPRVINTDGHSAYSPAIVRLKAEGVLEKDCRRRPVPYLNNVLEQDRRAIKRRVNASQHFRSFWAAWRTIVGYETIHMIRKGQGVRKCAGWEGCSAAPLHSRPVQRGGGLILRTLSPNFALTPKLQHYRIRPRRRDLGCVAWFRDCIGS
jgi:hypothetical protein